jgi:hypothetical protein
MAIGRSTWADDTGLSDGSVENNAELQKIYDNIDANSGANVTTSAVGTQNNFNPGIAGLLTTVRCTNASLLTITGFPAGFNGQQIVLYPTVAQVDFSNADAGSSVGNKLANIATSGKTSMALGGSTYFVYDATGAVWRLLDHEQGAWITPAFAAGQYSASGTMGWTVAAGNVATQKYKLRGRDLTVAFGLGSTTVVAPVASDLWILNTAFGGFTINGQFNNAIAQASDNGVIVPAFIQTGGTFLRLLKTSIANWTAQVGTLAVTAQITVEVT